MIATSTSYQHQHEVALIAWQHNSGVLRIRTTHVYARNYTVTIQKINHPSSRINSSTASAEVKRDNTLAFFFGCEISDWISKEEAIGWAALELAAEDCIAGIAAVCATLEVAEEEIACTAEELEAEKSGALAGSGDSNLCNLRGGWILGLSGLLESSQGLGAPKTYGRTGARASRSMPSLGVV